MISPILSSQDREAGEKSVVNIIGASQVISQNIVVDANSTNAFGIVIGGTDSSYSQDAYQDSEIGVIFSDGFESGDLAARGGFYECLAQVNPQGFDSHRDDVIRESRGIYL